MPRRGQPTPDAQETAWIVATRSGQRHAFAPLVERYQRQVFHIAWRMLGDRAEALDAAQDAFLRAYESLERFEIGRSFSAWLYRIAVNGCVDRLRRRRELYAPDLDATPGPASNSQDEIERRQEIAAVEAALLRLPEDYRIALILKDIQELDYETMAEILDESITALKIRVVRGRAKLAQQFRKLYPELVPTVFSKQPPP